MFGLYTVNIKLLYDKQVIAVLYKKLFLFEKNAEKFAEDIESVGAGIKLTEKFDKNLFRGLVTISNRSQEEYYFKKVPCECEFKRIMVS